MSEDHNKPLQQPMCIRKIDKQEMWVVRWKSMITGAAGSGGHVSKDVATELVKWENREHKEIIHWAEKA